MPYRNHVGWTLLAFALACRDHGAVSHEPPGLNIVLILTDDQRSNTLTYMPRVQALLGSQGVVFNNAFATTPLCCPSRASILTGLYTHNHGVVSNTPESGARKFVDTSTIATWLQKAGYRTGLFGKYLNHYDLLVPLPYRPPGWSVWNAFVRDGYNGYSLADSVVKTYSEYSTDLLVNRAVAFVRSTPASQHFFLLFAPFAPHPPAIPATQDSGSFRGLPAWRPPSFFEADVSDKPAWVRALPALTPDGADKIDRFRRRQVETLQAVDRAVEQIVNVLQKTGRLESTVIIFVSDNGFSWGEHRHTDKNCVYEECIRVPFLIRAPGVTPRQDAHLVALVDLGPTIADLAGISPPGKVNGMNLVPLLHNSGIPWRSELLLEVLGKSAGGPEGLFSGLRTDRYVYSELTSGERELYDLQADPFELVNLASDTSQALDRLHTLRARLLALEAE